jgi:DNA-binding MarR family transcriptional regulator
MRRRANQANDGEALGDLLGYQLRRASSEMMATLAADLAPIALTVVDTSVLLAVVEAPGSTQSHVGARLDIHRANMAPLVTKLESRHLVGRRRGDGRSAGLFATADGKRVAVDALRILRAHDARYLPELSPRDRERLLRWLRRVWSPQPVRPASARSGDVSVD